MPERQPFIVGHQAEVQHFDALLADHSDYWLFNYSPGDIGKTASVISWSWQPMLNLGACQ